jgi:hypothetical protein
VTDVERLMLALDRGRYDPDCLVPLADALQDDGAPWPAAGLLRVRSVGWKPTRFSLARRWSYGWLLWPHYKDTPKSKVTILMSTFTDLFNRMREPGWSHDAAACPFWVMYRRRSVALLELARVIGGNLRAWHKTPEAAVSAEHARV